MILIQIRSLFYIIVQPPAGGRINKLFSPPAGGRTNKLLWPEFILLNGVQCICENIDINII